VGKVIVLSALAGALMLLRHNRRHPPDPRCPRWSWRKPVNSWVDRQIWRVTGMDQEEIRSMAAQLDEASQRWEVWEPRIRALEDVWQCAAERIQYGTDEE
jgi:hypothetical protein